MSNVQTQQFPTVPFTLAQAQDLGITRRQLRTAVTNGHLRHPFTNVYFRADLTDCTELRAAGLALVVPPHVVVCDRTAAWIHGVSAFGYVDLELDMPVEVCSLRGHGVVDRRGVDGRSRDLRPDDLMCIGSITVTTPLRTALDLGCGLTRMRAIGVLDEFRRKFGMSLAQLQMGALRYRRRRGVVQLRQILPLTDPRAESPRESWTRDRIHVAGLPAPTLQHRIEINGVLICRLDLAYPRSRVAIEYDGKDFHTLTWQQRERTRLRRQWLEDNGWTVIVVNMDNFFDKDGSGWLLELRDALRPRTRRLRWSARVSEQTSRISL